MWGNDLIGQVFLEIQTTPLVYIHINIYFFKKDVFKHFLCACGPPYNKIYRPPIPHVQSLLVGQKKKKNRFFFSKNVSDSISQIIIGIFAALIHSWRAGERKKKEREKGDDKI